MSSLRSSSPTPPSASATPAPTSKTRRALKSLDPRSSASAGPSSPKPKGADKAGAPQLFATDMLEPPALPTGAAPMPRAQTWHVGDPVARAQLREDMKLDRLKERIQHRRHNEGSAIPFKWRVAILATGVAVMTGICVGLAFVGGIPSLVVLAVVPNLFVAGVFFMAKDYRRAPDPNRMSKRTLQALGLLDRGRSEAAFAALKEAGIVDPRRQHVESVPDQDELTNILTDVLGSRVTPQLINKIHVTLQQYAKLEGEEHDARGRPGSGLLRRRSSMGA